jgi:hypothetical protein
MPPVGVPVPAERPVPPARRQRKQAEKQAEKLARKDAKLWRKQERKRRRRRRLRRLANFVIGLIRGGLAAIITVFAGAAFLADRSGVSPDNFAPADQLNLGVAGIVAFFIGVLVFPFPRYLREKRPLSHPDGPPPPR